MNKINRHELVRALAKFQTKESPDNSRLTLRDVSRWLDVLDLRRRDAVREMNRHFARDLDAARLAVAVIGAFAFHLGVGEGAQDFKRPWKPGLPPTGPLPMDWIDSRGRPDPNFFLVSLVTQVANQGLAVLTLIEQGLESPARSMLRTFIELVSTTLIVVGDQERMRVYTKAAHPVAARKAWQKYFTKGEALKTLRDIQVSIGLSRRMADGVAKERFGDYEYYSASVHHAALPALVWAYTPSFYTKKRLA